MSQLLQRPPFGTREDALLLEELNELTRRHIEGCPPYARIWAHHGRAETLAEVPYLHVGLFKRIDLRSEGEGVKHQRTLLSSATREGVPSRIFLDAQSSLLQTRSLETIFSSFLGETKRPLLVLDCARSLRKRDEVSARIAAALSLSSMTNDIRFLLRAPEDPLSLDWRSLCAALEGHDEAMFYGFTWMLWQALGVGELPAEAQWTLAGKKILFIHSGGWKHLEASGVARETFDAGLLRHGAEGSRVLDFYGLVEQAGVVYPLCPEGARHVPVWAEVFVRDPYTLAPLERGETGLLQLMNTLALGAPYHSVLTEDLGRILPGECGCGRKGRRFELLGRLSNAETRGCANV